MKKAFIISSVLAPFFALILLAIHFSVIFHLPYTGESKVFTVSAGEGFASVNARLYKEGIISDTRLFHYYAKYQDKMRKIKVGSYEINEGMHMGDVLNTLVSGVPILNSVTIPEGKNMYEIADILESKGITSAKEFLLACRSQSTISMLNIKAPSVEGYLFPDTYRFAPKMFAISVVKSMVNVFKRKTQDLSFKTSSLSAHEVIILASIVEKETGAKFERKTIAGVYLNRLKKRMRLQADPTTIYGIWENYNGNLKKKHLYQKTPYNTYKISGLPLGPIANPGLAAIKAVLSPKKHNYLYFVSKNDGTHVFTSTYKEHLKAVDYWQKNIKNRKGKSWRDLKQ